MLTDYAGNKSHLSLSQQPLVGHKDQPAIAKDSPNRPGTKEIKSLSHILGQSPSLTSGEQDWKHQGHEDSDLLRKLCSYAEFLQLRDTYRKSSTDELMNFTRFLLESSLIQFSRPVNCRDGITKYPKYPIFEYRLNILFIAKNAIKVENERKGRSFSLLVFY